MISTTLSLAEAAAILRVSVDADAGTVNRAFRAIVTTRHPDHGGALTAEELLCLRDARAVLHDRALAGRAGGPVLDLLL